MKQVCMHVKLLPHWNNHGRHMLKVVFQLIIMAVNPTIMVQHMQRIPMIKLPVHIPLYVCEF